MKPETIAFEDLLQEVHIDSPAEFRRLLRANHLPVLSAGSQIPAATADKICKRLMGRSVDWYRYQQHVSPQTSDGPLSRHMTALMLSKVARWGKAILAERTGIGEGQHLTGLSLEGGFLTDKEGGPLLVAFRPGMNILIGDRGAGKSTVLNSLSAIASTTTRTSDALLTKIMQLIDEPNLSQLERTLLRTLRRYGIRHYGLFFRRHKDDRCLVVDSGNRSYGVAALRGQYWIPLAGSPDELVDIQVLQQGDVNRIADNPKAGYLTGLADALFPELAAERARLAAQVRRFLVQAEHYTREANPHFSVLQSFLVERRIEVKALRSAIRRKMPSAGEAAIYQDYLDRYREVLKVGQGNNLVDRLRGDYDSLWVLYVGPMFNRLSKLVTRLSELSRRSGDRGAHGNAQTVAIELDDLVSRRLKIFTEWMQAWNSSDAWTPAFSGLVKSYVDIIDSRLQLVSTQDEYCSKIGRTLTRDGQVVHVFTQQASAVRSRLRQDRNRLSALLRYGPFLSEATTRQESEFSRALTAYSRTSARLREGVKQLTTDAAAGSVAILPIEVNVTSGSTLRSFEELSFGQKSGLILQMALELTTKPIVMIDQPEDNLDAHGVLDMLAPSLRAIAAKRQVIIATHSSNLALGLGGSWVTALASSGEYGYVRVAGTTRHASVTRAIIEVLEGGAQAFETKLRLYGEFIERLTGGISDMDIGLIESTFRRRTIDSLRNFLQPVVSDHALISILKHELTQPTRLAQSIGGVMELASRTPLEASLGTSLDNLLVSLRDHIERLRSKVDEMRMLDTVPRPTATEAITLLRAVEESYLIRAREGGRNVVFLVDSSLENVFLWIDRAHLSLILENLIRNSLRATERRSSREGQSMGAETISVTLSRKHPKMVEIDFCDNGCGIPSDFVDRLYVERCTDQLGRNHGLGGIIIRKLLEINGGGIQVLSSVTTGENKGTCQKLTLPTASIS